MNELQGFKPRLLLRFFFCWRNRWRLKDAIKNDVANIQNFHIFKSYFYMQKHFKYFEEEKDDLKEAIGDSPSI